MAQIENAQVNPSLSLNDHRRRPVTKLYVAFVIAIIFLFLFSTISGQAAVIVRLCHDLAVRYSNAGIALVIEYIKIKDVQYTPPTEQHPQNLESKTIGEPKGLRSNDPESLLKAFIVPVFLWFCSMVTVYAIRRFHLARVIYDDVDYRLRFGSLRVFGIEKWLREIEKPWSQLTKLPFLRTWQETHFIYADLQEDLRHCLWTYEVAAVRIFYRDFEEIEHRAGKIQECYQTLVELHPQTKAVPAGATTKRACLEDRAKAAITQIRKHYAVMVYLVDFWSDLLCTIPLYKLPSGLVEFDATIPLDRKIGKEKIGKDGKELTFPHAAQKMLFAWWRWYLIFWLIPFGLGLSAIIGSILELYGLIEFPTFWRLLTISGGAIGLAGVIAFFLYGAGKKIIRREVIVEIEDRLVRRFGSLIA